MLAFLLEKEPHVHSWKSENALNSKVASTRFGKLTHTYAVYTSLPMMTTFTAT